MTYAAIPEYVEHSYPQDWEILTQKIITLAENHASAKDLGNTIAKDEEFSTRLISLAGCRRAAQASTEAIVRAVVLLGTERVCELAQSQQIWRNLV